MFVSSFLTSHEILYMRQHYTHTFRPRMHQISPERWQSHFATRPVFVQPFRYQFPVRPRPMRPVIHQARLRYDHSDFQNEAPSIVNYNKTILPKNSVTCHLPQTAKTRMNSDSDTTNNAINDTFNISSDDSVNDCVETQTHLTDMKKTFSCPQCKYSTDRKNNLKRHIITMHFDSDRKLECCGATFRSKAKLREHVVLFHKDGYRCMTCGRSFCRKALLRRHMAVHSGKKDFLCNLCDYATSHKSNLERHQKVHQKLRGFDNCDLTVRSYSPNKFRKALPLEKVSPYVRNRADRQIEPPNPTHYDYKYDTEMASRISFNKDVQSKTKTPSQMDKDGHLSFRYNLDHDEYPNCHHFGRNTFNQNLDDNRLYKDENGNDISSYDDKHYKKAELDSTGNASTHVESTSVNMFGARKEKVSCRQEITREHKIFPDLEKEEVLKTYVKPTKEKLTCNKEMDDIKAKEKMLKRKRDTKEESSVVKEAYTAGADDCKKKINKCLAIKTTNKRYQDVINPHLSPGTDRKIDILTVSTDESKDWHKDKPDSADEFKATYKSKKSDSIDGFNNIHNSNMRVSTDEFKDKHKINKTEPPDESRGRHKDNKRLCNLPYRCASCRLRFKSQAGFLGHLCHTETDNSSNETHSGIPLVEQIIKLGHVEKK